LGSADLLRLLFFYLENVKNLAKLFFSLGLMSTKDYRNENTVWGGAG
jgi:hypothetical protein